jgi:hypothetical protein
MNRLRRLLLLSLSGGLALWLAPSGLLAEPAGKNAKRPDPGKQLASAYKTLSQKTKSYKVDVAILGGLSDNAEHKVTTANVRESYSGEVFRSQLMHVPQMKAFRTPTKSVGFFDGTWKDALQNPQGRLMDRLFAFPEIVLSRAVRYASTAEWVEGEGAVAGGEEAGRSPRPAAKRGAPRAGRRWSSPRGKTPARRAPCRGSSASRRPRRRRSTTSSRWRSPVASAVAEGSPNSCPVWTRP